MHPLVLVAVLLVVVVKGNDDVPGVCASDIVINPAMDIAGYTMRSLWGQNSPKESNIIYSADVITFPNGSNAVYLMRADVISSSDVRFTPIARLPDTGTSTNPTIWSRISAFALGESPKGPGPARASRPPRRQGGMMPPGPTMPPGPSMPPGPPGGPEDDQVVLYFFHVGSVYKITRKPFDERKDYTSPQPLGPVELLATPALVIGDSFKKIAGAGLFGSNNGAASVATFGATAQMIFENSPSAPGQPKTDRLYISDTDNHCIRLLLPGAAPNELTQGVVTTVVGTCGTPGNSDGITTNATFNKPGVFAPRTSSGTLELIVSDDGNKRLMSIVTTDAGVFVNAMPIRLLDAYYDATNQTSYPAHSSFNEDALPLGAITNLKVADPYLQNLYAEFGSQSAADDNLYYAAPRDNCSLIVLSYRSRGEMHIVSLPFTHDLAGYTVYGTSPDGCGTSTISSIIRSTDFVIGVLTNSSPTPFVVFGSLCEEDSTNAPGGGTDSETPDGPPGSNDPSGPDGPGNIVDGPNSNAAPEKAESNDTAIIAGAAVGGLIVIAAIVIVSVFLVTKNKQNQVRPIEDGEGESMRELRGSTGGDMTTASNMSTIRTEGFNGFNSMQSVAEQQPGGRFDAASKATTAATLSALSLGMPEDEGDRKKFLVENHQYQKNKLLGRGANGSVYSALLADGSSVAMKEVLLPSNALDLREEIQGEINIIKALHHPNVVEYYGSLFDDDEMKLLLFMEIVSSGSLATMARNTDGCLHEAIAKVYVRQLVQGVAYIHAKGVVHRDLKCDNVLLTSDGMCKIADFGASKTVGNTVGASRAANTMIGTPYFMAPEILMGAMADDDEEGEAGYGKKADVWSLGITVLEMLNRGNPPWPDFANQGAAFMHIASPQGMPIIPDRLSPECRDFVLRCCDRDVKNRATANELLVHPWLEEDETESGTPLVRSTLSTK